MLNKKSLLTVLGAAGAIASGAAIVDFIAKKANRRSGGGLGLSLGLTGLVASTALLLYAQTSPIGEEEYEDMLSDEDIALMDANISEVLGSSEDRAEKKPSGIEVDEDTTIEDFIEG
jgi:hypothetical protein